MVSTADLRAIAGTKTAVKMMDELAHAFNAHAARYSVDTQKRAAQFLANVCVETGGFCRLSESLNYSVAGLLKTFGRHRISEADAKRYGRGTDGRKADQKSIANLVYGGAWGEKNLGNTRPDDGWDYRGSGPGQVTGRANFARVEKETGLPVVSDPDLLRQPDAGMQAALILWQKWGLNEMADRGETDAIRKRWNGGTNGLAEVKAAYARAMQRPLAVPSQAPVAPADPKPEVALQPKPAAPAPVSSPSAPAVIDRKAGKADWLTALVNAIAALLKGQKK
ncbi:MAG: hypothetical protein QMD99_21455 [Rhizobiaceae bacterium]|nr:hypothetical protein [Rhizobiaceae bacterium]